MRVRCPQKGERFGMSHTAENEELFSRAPILRAVTALVVPTVVSQLITVLYNMADTFFIGQIGDPNQVAAVSLCMPMFLFLTGLANLFGIGGASLISRSLGAGDLARARRAAAFSFYAALAVSLLYGLGLYAFSPLVLPAVGANAETYAFCRSYVLWTIALGSVPTVLSQELAHLLRSLGDSRRASFGLAMGGILNMILDPIFILAFRWEIAGAAIATLLSNVIATLYFLQRILRKGEGKAELSLSPRDFGFSGGIPKEVLLVGLPSCAMNMTSVLSNIVLNRLLVFYSNAAVAGIGVAKKIDMLSFALATGMSQGVLPLIGYNYAAGNFRRMLSAIRTTFALSLGVAVVSATLLFTCAGPIVRAFIDDAQTVAYGQYFQRVICITGPCISVTMLIITIFQSVGRKVQPLVLSLLRKGGLDIPFMFLMNALAGLNGIVWATPIADFLAMSVSLSLFLPFWRKLLRRIQEKEPRES
jgi:multidrug efflux pump